MTAPLLEVPENGPARKSQACDRCLTAIRTSDDGLRVRGWMVYNGRSQTGKLLHIRICPTCKSKGPS